MGNGVLNSHVGDKGSTYPSRGVPTRSRMKDEAERVLYSVYKKIFNISGGKYSNILYSIGKILKLRPPYASWGVQPPPSSLPSLLTRPVVDCGLLYRVQRPTLQTTRPFPPTSIVEPVHRLLTCGSGRRKRLWRPLSSPCTSPSPSGRPSTAPIPSTCM